MNILWEIGDDDVAKVKAFFARHCDSPFVMNRIARNVKKSAPKATKDLFWQAMVSCLLTTQQRSGPKSAVSRFICTDPFPLNYKISSSQSDLNSFALTTITRFGGIRRGNKIADEVSKNFEWVETGGWPSIMPIVHRLENDRGIQVERESAEFITDNLKGFGPKQARNLLQSLGLTRFEIPVDSRIIKWLNEFGFPIKLSAAGLTDKSYYNFILDGVQLLCERSGLYPCALDAAIFSSFDAEWPEDSLIW